MTAVSASDCLTLNRLTMNDVTWSFVDCMWIFRRHVDDMSHCKLAMEQNFSCVRKICVGLK